MLEWAAEQATEITTTAIDLEFLPTDANEDRGVHYLEFVLQQIRCTRHSWLSRVMRRTTLLPARGRTRWRHGGGCRNDMIRRQEEGYETFCARSMLLDGSFFWNSKRGLNSRSPYVSRYEKKMKNAVSQYEEKSKDKLDDEIKLAGLESLVPEELEKHLILNSNRLRTFEDARLEVVTYVEAKFGLKIRDSKPSDTGARGHSDPMDADAINSLSSGKGKVSSSPRDGCSKCGGAHFQRDCMHARAQASNRLAKANRARHCPRVRAKARVKKTKENPKENTKENKHKGKTSKTGLSRS